MFIHLYIYVITKKKRMNLRGSRRYIRSVGRRNIKEGNDVIIF